ncbi:ceramide phosphoethanolamine synthase isoform X1 [Haematobia irritans]|uniref:ceramide phosphoethanolamine synthase isoform X1 n=1 Tax=Haematobia irritans TaxID=7368 RepID=UPI003F50761C
MSSNDCLSVLPDEGDPMIKGNLNNIVYCLEKYQITILASEYGIRNLDLIQYLDELGWNSKGIIALVESYTYSFASTAEKYCFGKHFLEGSSNIISITEERLLNELFHDPLLTNVGVVIMNEVQKRTVFMDTILAVMKKIIRKRSTIKLVLVSTSSEANFFAEYFSNHKERGKSIKCAVLSIGVGSAKCLQQDMLFLEKPCADYVKKTIQTIISIHTKTPLDGDIIAYMADEDDITEAMYLLKNMATEGIENLNYFKLSQMKNDHQTVFFPIIKGKRNVIFTIDLYQKSVTHDRINYVIDCGYMCVKWYDPALNRDHRFIVPVCKYTAALRSNWSSKYRMAKIFRLYTKSDYQLLPQRTVVEMRRTRLCFIVLYLKALAVENILRFDFPSVPPAKNMFSSLETLYALGAIDDTGHLTNPLGYFLSESPFSPNLSRCLFNSVEFRCTEEMLIIICMLQIETAFIVTNNNTADRHKQVAKRSFEAAEGDLITLLNIYNAFIENNRSKEFCRKYYLNYNNLLRAQRLKEHMISTLLNKYNIHINSVKSSTENVLRCITSGYFMNIAYLHSTGVYRTLRCGSEVFIDRESSVYTLPQPKYVTYCELYDKSKIFMRNLSVIEEVWLDELAPHYYKRKS